MVRATVDSMDKDTLMALMADYRKRFRMINQILQSYGSISNDDLLGLISKSLPEDPSKVTVTTSHIVIQPHEKAELDGMSRDALVEDVDDYLNRFQTIGQVLNSYGTISNDDLIGLIYKSIPDENAKKETGDSVLLGRLDKDTLIDIVLDYRERLRMVNQVLMNYGAISNDDIMEFISKALPNLSKVPQSKTDIVMLNKADMNNLLDEYRRRFRQINQ